MPAAGMPFQVIAKPAGARCNLNCSYCFYLEKQQLYPGGRPLRMPAEVLAALIDQSIAASPGPEVYFAWQGGEPTLMGLDFFREVVRLQRRRLPPGWRAVNTLQTNGILLDEAWCRFLAREQFLVGLSLDGSAPEHDRHRVDRSGRPTHHRVMAALERLQRYGVDVNLLCVLHRENVTEPLRLYRYFRELGVAWLQFIPLVEPLGGGRVSPRSVPAAAYGDFLVAVFDEWVRRDVGRTFVQIIEESLLVWSGQPAGLCHLAPACGRGLALEHNGDLFSCDHFVTPAHRLGNILERPLAELANSPQQRQFGQAKQRLPQSCRGCEVRFVCQGGCPKDRLLPVPGETEPENYLCPGYRRFFRHIAPYMERMVALWRSGRSPAGIMAELAPQRPAGPQT